MDDSHTDEMARTSDSLVVDDNPENLKVLGDFFTEQGYNVRVARDGKQALANALSSPPQVILLDIHMPVMDGYETCAAMKAEPTLKDCPVIFLSALGETFNKVRGFECGGVDYITKPFHLEEVRVRVRNHVQTSRLLAESRAGFRASFEQSAVGMAQVAPDGRLLAVNPRWCALFGQTAEALLGTALTALAEAASAPVLETALAAAARGEAAAAPVEIACVAADGGPLWCRCTLSPVRVPSTGREYVSVILEDVTEHRRGAEERRRLVAALEQMVEAVAVTDASGVVQYVNPAYEQIFGAVEGRKLSLLDAEADGQPAASEIWAALTGGGVWTGRVEKASGDGRPRTEEYTLSPVRDGAGAITNYVATARDLTRQLRLEEQLRQSQKMEAIGTLAAGIAHDFNNMLAAIIGFTQLTMEELGEGHSCHRNLEEVMGAGGHATELVRQILTFARQTAYEVQPVRVQQVAEDALKLLRRSIPPTVQIHTNIQGDCDPVLADATCVHQIFMNLCTNAYQAMGSDGGTLTVRITEVTLGDEMIHAGTALAPGQYVRLDVNDTGHGMDRETAQRIFEPYFTTKDRGQGTGLGLATVHGIVTDLKGAIVVYSEPGSGSTFTVFLPAVPGEAAGSERPKKALDGMPGSERVLFVDDERPLRLMAERALGRLGYRVTAVGNPKEALALLEADPQGFDVVITDEMMPGMRGTELLAAVRALRPGLPVILYSGFSESLRSNPRGAEAFDGHVMKPMVVSELSLAIREALLHPRGA